MKRDLERIREILIECDASDGHTFSANKNLYSDFDLYQITLMEQAGLVKILTGATYNTQSPPSTLGLARRTSTSFQLSWAGHEYLDAIRDIGIWEQTKTAVAETGGNAALEIVKALAMGFLKKKISQHTGIDV